MQPKRWISLWIVLLVLVAFQAPILAEEVQNPLSPPSLPSEVAAPASVNAESVLLINAETGQVLYEKNADQRMFPASTTKIMTALIAVERIGDEEMLTAPANVADLEEGATSINLQAGEVMSFKDLLYALLLPSANDAAIDIATHISGSVPAFAELMNEKAASLGMTGTHYVNPHGLHDESHYTTARDLAILAQAACRNEKIMEVAGTYEYTLPADNLRAKSMVITNTNLLVSENPKEASYAYESATGMKTGYTGAAQATLVASAEQDGTRLIAVILKDGKNNRFETAKALFEYGFSQYPAVDLGQLAAYNIGLVGVNKADWFDALDGKVYFTVNANDAFVNLERSEAEALIAAGGAQLEVQYDRELTAPIREGEVLGTVKLSGVGGASMEGTLVAARSVNHETLVFPVLSVEYASAFNWMILLYVLLGLLLLLFLRMFQVAHRRRKRRKRQASRPATRGKTTVRS